MLVKDSNDFMVVSLVYRQAKSFAHGELSEPGRFAMGRVSVSYITDLEVRRQFEPQVEQLISDPPWHGTRVQCRKSHKYEPVLGYA